MSDKDQEIQELKDILKKWTQWKDSKSTMFLKLFRKSYLFLVLTHLF